ncbi:MAG TPA: hypothetical protein VN837_17040 [Chloroflexota bacterium]|nr:hypothetical protein [Chloroflexota bacterium]
MNRGSTLPVRLVLILAILTAGLLGGGLLALGYGGAGIARGTSEAIGYPTDTPMPPPPPPLNTATSVPVPPTATTAPVPPTATTAPATATLIPPTASPTRAPSTATPSPTPTSTRTATATPTATPRPAVLSLHLSSPVVAAGDTLVLTVRTLPGLAVKAVVRYPTLNQQVVVTGKADQKGVSQLKVLVTESPRKGKPGLAAVIALTVSDRVHRTTKTISFTVYPSLRFAVSAKLVTRASTRDIAVSVSLARAAAIDVHVLLTGKGQRPANAHEQATRAGKVTLLIPIPEHHGIARANLRITVRTREGVIETRELSVPVGP